jgi:small-conductance mechanosensitive channel
VLRTWGISSIYATTFYAWLAEGFSLGKIHIVPARVGVGFLFFSIGWTAVTLLREKIVRRWLAESDLSASIQDAFTTVFGYAGFCIAVLVGLSTAGIDFSGIAMIIGALSVGIGFGLQNIVNNLISGLILLFERPIKRGDWIVVGTTEGYVKKISVRSTIIQTFDRSDVIVPKSELIASQVTNMMLHDVRGRLRIPIGVAYGSNTELVRELLLRVAQEHPEVLSDGSVPKPAARFQAFGESSLNFELFCYLKDVDKRIEVRSDLHFAIDKVFRQHDIVIPFPQRDLHIKSYPQNETDNAMSGRSASLPE